MSPKILHLLIYKSFNVIGDVEKKKTFFIRGGAIIQGPNLEKSMNVIIKWHIIAQD